MIRSITGLILLAALLWLINTQLSTPAATQPTMTLKVLDVGQGDSLYIRLPTSEDVVIDAGPSDSVLAPLGRALPIGDRRIELLIISHNHADHIGGAVALLQRYKVDQIWLSGSIHTTDTYLQLLETIKTQQIPTVAVKAGDNRQFGEARLTVLHPPTDMIQTTPEDQHDSTVVVKVAFKDFCVLLTGDLNTNQSDHESVVLQAAQQLNESTDCQALKVTHHASKSGTTQAFLAAVTPEVALISVGKHNKYGHPAPSVLQRLEQASVRTYRTDLHGTVTITTNGSQFWTRTEK